MTLEFGPSQIEMAEDAYRHSHHSLGERLAGFVVLVKNRIKGTIDEIKYSARPLEVDDQLDGQPHLDTGRGK